MIADSDLPTGWWPLAWSRELGSGEVQPRRLHGQELVLWRGESGHPHVLDAFCLHLGHHLGYNGRVCGEEVRCFFHGWQWSPEGLNTLIPYDDRTHKGRRITVWPVAEAGGLILVGRPATDSEPAPELHEVRGTEAPLTVRLEPALLLENLLDPYTAGPLLGARIGPQPPELACDGRRLRARHHCAADDRLTVDITVHGPGVATLRFGGIGYTLAVTPRGEEVEVRWGWSGEVAAPAGAAAALREFVDLTARMAASPPTGMDVISELRAWLAAHGTTRGRAHRTTNPTLPERGMR